MGMDKWMDVFQGLKETATVEKVFGPPQTMGDRTIIPVAEVAYAFGGGFGKGKKKEPAEGEEAPEGEGGGGGGRVKARPVAVLEVTPEGLCVVPIRDETKMEIAKLTAVTVGICMACRTMGKMMYARSMMKKKMMMMAMHHKGHMKGHEEE